jgi:hypothetical protein
MPLSRPAPRQLLHIRQVDLRGYLREDGLVDLDARMSDEKTFSFANHDRDGIRAGEKLHDMWIRMTLTPQMEIVACEAVIDSSPFTICPQIAPNLSRLVGLTIGPGFIKAAMARVTGPEGCTHLRELLQPIATATFQTMVSVHAGKGDPSSSTTTEPFGREKLVNTCYAYGPNSPVMARRLPQSDT